VKGHDGVMLGALYTREAEVTFHSWVVASDWAKLFRSKMIYISEGKTCRFIETLLYDARSDCESIVDATEDPTSTTETASEHSWKTEGIFSQWHCDICAVGPQVSPSMQPTSDS
jgi:hypothetical protein